MVLAPDLPEFRPELLSVREREVLDLAIKGYIDEQIAAALNLSTSTINSYWVRIRGKLGQLSRTELVAKALHAGYREEREGLVADIARLKDLLAASNLGRARAESDLAAERGVSWHLLALHFVPDAVLVTRPPGHVEYANLQAERMFHAEPGALIGREVCELTVPQGRDDRRARIHAFLRGEVGRRMVMGVEEPSYGLAHNGENFRVTITAERFDAPKGIMAVFTIREFLGDVDAVLQSLRKPLVVL